MLPSAAARRTVFAILALALLMGAIDETIVSTALPTMVHAFDEPLSWVAWTFTSYQLGYLIALPLAGRISVHFGARRVFLAASVLFTVTSLLCGTSTNIVELIVWRGIQGTSGGTFVPSATGIIAASFGQHRGRFIGLFASIFPLGVMTGPILGGIIVRFLSWRWVFFVNLPIGAVLIPLALAVIPRTVARKAGRVDLPGAVLLGALMFAAMFGVTSLGAKDGSPRTPQFLASEAAALALLAVFVKHTKRTESPVIPPRFLRQRAFLVVNSLSVVYGAVTIGFSSLAPLYAQERYHLSALQAGTMLTARAVGSISVAGLVSFLLHRIGYRLPMTAGFLLLTVGLTVQAWGPPSVTPYVWLAFGALILGLGTGTASPATNNAAISIAPSEAAVLAGLRGMCRQVGGLVAVAVTSAIVARASDEGLALSHAFLAYGVLVLLAMPAIALVPGQRGTW